MNKKIGLVIAIAVIIGLIVMLVLPKQNVTTSLFECEPGYQVLAELGDKTAIVTLPGGEAIELSRVENTNGNRYRSADGTNEFWVQDDEAILKIGEAINYNSCLFIESFDSGNALANTSTWELYQSGQISNYQFVLQHPKNTKVREIPDGVSMTHKGKQGNSFMVAVAIIDNPTTLETLESQGVTNPDTIVFNGLEAFSYLDTDGSQVLAVVLDDVTTGLISYQVDGNNIFESAASNIVTSVVFAEAESTVGEGDNEVSRVSIALLDTSAPADSNSCDTPVLVDRQILPTTMPLTAAIDLLFTLPDDPNDDYLHFIPNTTDTLQFDRATVVGGVAKIYLTGELSGVNGACDYPRAQTQITETALQFDTVDAVEFYLNGTEVETLHNAVGARG